MRYAKALLPLMLIIAALPIRGAYAAPPPGLQVAEPFVDYYNQHDGMRVLGPPVGDLLEVDGYPAQLFEKGRLEDHREHVATPGWWFMFGLLTRELMEHATDMAVNAMDLTYGKLKQQSDPRLRVAPPPGFHGGAMAVDGGVFVPVESRLGVAPGHVVPTRFWSYINRAELFPGGWLHDIGLPLTAARTASTIKNGEQRTITYQAFERAVLTDDPRNPADWQVERGNLGADLLRARAILPPIELPAADTRATLPLHILARLRHPGEQIIALLRWQDGTKLEQRFTLLRGEDGRGLLIGNLDWVNLPQPPQPPTQRATLELRNQFGELRAQQRLTIVSGNDPATTEIKLFWTISGTERVGPQPRRIPRTEGIGAATLEELLWGPPAISQVGYQTAIPTPEQVLSFPGREADWGPRVRLRGLTIDSGVATADFSRELRAYGGGSLRVKLIRDQVSQTLLQFPSVRSVRIAIEGATEGVLEP